MVGLAGRSLPPLSSHRIAMGPSLIIRPAVQLDDEGIWRVIEPVFRAGETYPLPRDITRADAFAYWRAPGHEVFVAEDGGRIVGSYYLRANTRGGGSHVANCGYIVAADASRRGVARAMCLHSLERASAASSPCNSTLSFPATSER
jgi:predicted N-acetyltransferase YhbS